MRRGALAVALTSSLVVAGCGDAERASAIVSSRDVRVALEARLVDKKLSYRWVYCRRTRATFHESPVFRCNVNFGEPHIVRYCATLEDGKLVTNREQREMRCGRGADTTDASP